MEDKQILPETAPLELTFGVELELCVLSVPDQFLDPAPDDPRQAQGITRPERYPDVFLPYIHQQTPIMVDGVEEYDWPDEWYDQFNTLRRNMAEFLTGSEYPAIADCDYDERSHDSNIKDLDLWIVSMDRTIRHGVSPDAPGYYLWPVEIKSPAYIYNEENKHKVRDVLRILDTSYRTRCDLSADVHVHIGNGQNGFDVRTVRNVMAFVWTFERQLASIHDPHYMAGTAFSQPLTTHSYLASVSRESRAMLAMESGDAEALLQHDRNFVIDQIMSLKTVDEAVMMLSAINLKQDVRRNRLIYSICNLETGAEKVKKTIEFRQHGSTLDDEEVDHWITVCRSLVRFAIMVDEELLVRFCKKHINKTVEEFSLVEVLMAINRPMQAYYYGIRVAAATRKRKEKEAQEE